MIYIAITLFTLGIILFVISSIRISKSTKINRLRFIERYIHRKDFIFIDDAIKRAKEINGTIVLLRDSYIKGLLLFYDSPGIKSCPYILNHPITDNKTSKGMNPKLIIDNELNPVSRKDIKEKSPELQIIT